MVLELTASRLVAKHVGSSLYTWTSVIGVVLAGITVGNYFGGWLADRFAPPRILGWLFLVASLLSFSVLWTDQLAHNIQRGSLSWPTWVFLNVAGIFLLPSMALGTISPVVASLAISRSKRTGMTVGSVYAWGALGSIVGTFLTGFLLIQVFGSKAVIVMTAATLAAMGVLAAGGQRLFRAVVLVGWMQFLCVFGLFAAARVEPFREWVGSIGGLVSPGEQERTRIAGSAEWRHFGDQLGGSLHRMGLALGLRDDRPGEYYDESNYSTIRIGSTTLEGDRVRYIQLDKLVHAFYNPAIPTKLHYDYERVYAAVTERLYGSTIGSRSVMLADFPGRAELVDRLPGWIRFNPAQQTLEIDEPLNPSRRDELLDVAPIHGYWRVLQDLAVRSRAPSSGQLASVHLERLPEGVRIPPRLAEKIQFDDRLNLLTVLDELTDADLQLLIQAAPYAEFHAAVGALFESSRQLKTLFLGGGGFIFPRWIEANFPGDPLIDVAEIDPAVTLAVRRNLGLEPEGETSLNIFEQDARNFVDDRLLQNQTSDRPVKYDFIYGDAFNDYSIPFHLTTLEFARKLRQLLSDDGCYLANVIEIFPRSVVPTSDDDNYLTELPEPLLKWPLPKNDWAKCPKPFDALELYRVVQSDAPGDKDTEGNKDTEGGKVAAGDKVVVEAEDSGEELGYMLGVHGVMSETTRAELLELAADSPAFRAAINRLHDQSQVRHAGRFLSSYVNTLSKVFPCVYVFSGAEGLPTGIRDTYVVVCLMRPVDLSNLGETSAYWLQGPFAWLETDPESGAKTSGGFMESLLALTGETVLTDDFAPVNNYLAPVFETQE
jgi:hypothetical protein